MDDLLKEAIADAKAVRETALENAKIALEEAFTPRLQSMLSKKIQSEIEVEEGEHEDDEEKEEAMHDEDDDMEERGAEEAMHDEDEDDVEERATDEDEDDVEERAHEEDEDMDENVIEIDGVKYAPVVSEEEDEEDDDMEERMNKDEDDDMEEDLDLEAVLRELEEEEDEDDDEPKESVKEEEDDEDKEDVDEEVDATTGIGSSDNKSGTADKSSGIGTKDKAKHNESVEITEDDKEDVDEEIDLEEVIAALSEEDDEEAEVAEVSKLQSELDEHRNVVKYLRSKLNEVNLLNAKLLFTNKLFRSFGLTNDQKMKVVENFDRAHNLREVKLVYSTLAESFGTKTTKTEIKESKGTASKAVASTKSEKQEQEVIAEGSEMRDRFKKLAGIL